MLFHHVATPPVLTKDFNISILKSLLYGGLVGFFIYGIYNFTSLSIYNNYSLNIAIMDTLWGIFLYSTSVTLYLFI